ncbi:MAG: GIY-YIG nuclease family protein [Candidatus Magasanikbacteria bacterium]|nr:GIY-YIG nuclease family protein [Candidatus Magasanikbacteria bacterium]
MPNHNYYVYIIASVSFVLYIGVTNDLIRRVEEHKDGIVDGFTKKYKCKKLVYYESFFHVEDALKREKELKGWKRFRKVNLINIGNSRWVDLYDQLTS